MPLVARAMEVLHKVERPNVTRLSSYVSFFPTGRQYVVASRHIPALSFRLFAEIQALRQQETARTVGIMRESAYLRTHILSRTKCATLSVPRKNFPLMGRLPHEAH